MLHRNIRALLLALALAPCLARPVHAAKPGDGDWEAVNGQMLQPGETVPASGLVGAAYGFIWLMVAGFVWSVWRRVGAAEREIEVLRRSIEARAGASHDEGGGDDERPAR